MFAATALVFLAPRLVSSPLAVALALFALAAPALALEPFLKAPARRFLFALALGGTLALGASRALPRQEAALPFLPSQVRRIEGRLVADSGPSALDLRLEGCAAADGTRASARGIVRAYIQKERALARGTAVALEGRFSLSSRGLAFEASRLEVLRPAGRRARLRLKLADAAAARLGTEDGGSALAVMLVLGRPTKAGEETRDLARSCGCLHVLALSGLHLGFFSSLARRLLPSRRRRMPALLLGLLLSAAFVLFIGPRSSLLRAVFCLALGIADRLAGLGLAPMERLVLAALLQLGLFPDTLRGVGTAYSYAATAGLLFLGEPLSRSLGAVLPRRLASALGSGAGALVVSAVLSLRLDGFWSPAALALAPAACQVVFWAMAVGFLRLVWPRAEALRKAGNLLCRILHRLFGFPLAAGGWALAALALAMLTAAGGIRYARKKSHRRAAQDDLELQLRFAPGDQIPS